MFLRGFFSFFFFLLHDILVEKKNNKPAHFTTVLAVFLGSSLFLRVFKLFLTITTSHSASKKRKQTNKHRTSGFALGDFNFK